MLRYIPLVCLFLLVYSNLFAQIDREPAENDPAVEIRINQHVLYGKLVAENEGKGIEAASVQLYLLKDNQPDSLIGGMLSLANGDFRFTNVPAGSRLKLIVSAIGYAEIVKEIDFKGKDGATTKMDLGNLIIKPEAQVLEGVTITTKKPTLELGVDRKIFNVDKSLTATGGTAIDIMKNIPTVSVDIDGNVELRRSNPQILVDGRPTILTLDQIPADNIDKIELITNPSARFDASSSAGIINIVLKKNKRIGLNAVITAGAGTPGIFNSNLNLNLRQDKFNFFMSSGYNKGGGKAKGETKRENKENGQTENYFNQLTENNRKRRFTSVRFGMDYFIDNRNIIGVSQDFSAGKFSNKELQSQEYLNNSKVLEYYGERNAEGHSTFNRYSSSLNYKHDFPEQGKELTADIRYNYGPGADHSFINNAFYYPDGSVYQPASVVRNNGGNDNDQVTFQVDFVNPLKNEGKIETGFRSYYNLFSSFYDAYALENGQEVKLSLSNNYRYTEKINALYFTYSGKKDKFSYQFGLRAEHSQFDGELIDSAYKFGYTYPKAIRNIWDALFPSAFFSKQITEQDQLQVNYTRRIRRPRFWQLNPFIDINDPINLQQGNPELHPEFINSFEMNYNREYKTGNFLASVYFRNNPDDITRYSDTITTAQYEQLDNAAVDPNAILNTFINANTTNRYGAEFTLQQKFGENFDITPSIDFQYRTVNAKVKDVDLSNDGFNWDADLTLNYKFMKKPGSLLHEMSFQLSGEYESPEVIPQGKRDAQYSVDFALKKEFLKSKKASLTFAINDIFNTQRYGTTYDTDRFYQESYRRRNVRNFRLTFSYKFGDAKFSLFRNGGNRGGGDDE